MAYVIIKKERTDYDNRILADRSTRQREDVLKGLSRPKTGQRGDYSLCRRLDKTLNDYRNFKNPKDREKIKEEYFGLQKEVRRGG